MIYTVTKTKGGLISRVPLRKITPEVKLQARHKFNQARQDSMVNGGYYDDRWIFTNERKTVSIYFCYRDEELKRICEEMRISYQVFIEEVKTYVMLLYGTCDLGSLRITVNYSIDEIISSHFGTVLSEPSMKQNGLPLIKYIDYISISSLEISEAYIRLCQQTLNTIQDQLHKNTTPHPCRLSEFDSYFILDHCLQKYWKNASEDERKKYFPMYLFWRTTTILPLRVTEFLVTPYDCIREKDGRYYLTIRRSRLKGMSGKVPKIHGYTIESDYIKDEYEITRELYGWFKDYREITKDESHPYVVLITGHGEYLFDTEDLRHLFEDFYNEVIIGKYRYHLVTENDLLDRAANDGSFDLREGEIMMVQPKHTRHLAMVNLIIRGCNPSIIRQFAGHASDTMSANYYGNTVNLVRCAVKRFYEHTRTERQREVVVPDDTRNPLQMLIDRTANHIPVDGGSCYSERFLHHDISDCIACDGRCRFCRYFDPNKPNNELHKNEGYDLDAEFEYIRKMLKDENLENRIDEYNSKMSTFERHIQELAIDMLREKEKEDEETIWDENNYIQMTN